jgi:membrane protein implicated in regulation of membrane protease activity
MRSGKRGRLSRHRFEPARLVLGLALLAIAAIHLMRVDGRADIPLLVPAVALPVALLLAAVVAVVSLGRRRRRARRGDRPDAAADVSRTGAGASAGAGPR